LIYNGVMLKLEDVHTYHGPIEALKGIDIELNHGEIVCLRGLTKEELKEKKTSLEEVS